MADDDIPEPTFHSEAERLFFESLVHSDGMVAVLRGHLFIESALNDILRARLGRDADVIFEHLEYSQKYDLARRLKLITRAQKRQLQVLGELRNSFAHTLERSLTFEDEEKVFKSLDDTSKTWIREYVRVHPERNELGLLVRLGILMVQAEIRSLASTFLRLQKEGRYVININEVKLPSLDDEDNDDDVEETGET